MTSRHEAMTKIVIFEYQERTYLPLQKEFVLFQTNGSAQDDFVGGVNRQALVGIVKDDFDKGVDGRAARTFVQQGLPFFLSYVVVVIVERDERIHYGVRFDSTITRQ